MKHLIWTVMFISVCMTSCDVTPELDIVPYPNEVSIESGSFNAKGSTITYDQSLDAATVNVIKAFAEKLSYVSGAENALSAGTADMGIVFVYNAEIQPEAYVLDVNPEMVRVQASGLRGFNYAIQTLKQLLPVGISCIAYQRCSEIRLSRNAL